MLKSRSSFDFYPSEHFFAVYPVSLQFERQYTTRFHLYFQKNLQIISKHQFPLEVVKKDQIVPFGQVEQTNHFRVQSQKNLQYSWSLYFFRLDIAENNEEFIEGQKITLKEPWNLYKGRRQSVFEQSVKFNSIKFRLNYVIIIGKNNQEVLDSTQKYFEQKASVITSGQKLLPVTQQFQEQAKVQELKVQPNQNVPSQSKAIQVTQKEELIAPEQIIPKDESKGIEDMKMSAIAQNGHLYLQTNLTPQNRQGKTIQNLLSSREEQNVKLSNSEIEIGMQIEEIVLTKETSLKGRTNENVQQILKEAEKQEKNIILTNSQILDEKKELIEPIYKQKSVLIGLILLVIVILGGGFLALRNKNVPAVQTKNKKTKKGKNEAKEVVNKKVKGKK